MNMLYIEYSVSEILRPRALEKNVCINTSSDHATGTPGDFSALRVFEINTGSSKNNHTYNKKFCIPAMTLLLNT
jgi:hypothetical protein